MGSHAAFMSSPKPSLDSSKLARRGEMMLNIEPSIC